LLVYLYVGKPGLDSRPQGFWPVAMVSDTVYPIRRDLFFYLLESVDCESAAVGQIHDRRSERSVGEPKVATEPDNRCTHGLTRGAMSPLPVFEINTLSAVGWIYRGR
jgi:hypothetical protein